MRLVFVNKRVVSSSAYKCLWKKLSVSYKSERWHVPRFDSYANEVRGTKKFKLVNASNFFFFFKVI